MLLQAFLIWWIYWRPIRCSAHQILGPLKDPNTTIESPFLPTSVKFGKGINKRPILLGHLKTSVLRAPHVKIPVQVRPQSEVVETLHEPHGLLPVNPTGNM